MLFFSPILPPHFFSASRRGHFLATTRLPNTSVLIGAHHVHKIAFSNFVDFIVLLMMINNHFLLTFIVFLLSGFNIEGNLSKHVFEFKVHNNYARPRDFRGSQTMYCKQKSSFYFLLSPDPALLEVVTNHATLKSFPMSSSSAKPNINFIIARFASGIMKFLNWVKDPHKDKLFEAIQCHMIIQYTALSARQS